MTDTARYKTWTDPVDLVARALDDVATAAVANAGVPSAAALRTIAGEVLDELLAEPLEPPPAVERHADAVRLVEDTIDATSTFVQTANRSDRVAIPTERTGPAIVEALFGIPTVTLHDDGRLEVDWHDTPTHRPRACIVARDLLDDIVERLNGERTPSNHDGLLDALGDAIARAHEARPLVEAAPALAPLSPDCKAGKCAACTGDAWCEHPCHAARVERDADEEPST